jgi:hypothetical protein
MEQERQQQQPPQHQLTPVVPSELKAPAVAPQQQKPVATATSVPGPRPWPLAFTPK